MRAILGNAWWITEMIKLKIENTFMLIISKEDNENFDLSTSF